MSALPPPADDKAPEKIPAEKRFDQAVYGGISYAAQAGTGIALTYWMQHAGGRKYFDRIAEWLGPRFLSKITSKKGPDAVKEASSWIIVSSMIMVGNAFLLPVKWLENRKARFVRAINDRMNEKCAPSPEEREAQEARIHYLEHHAPKQNWWSLIGGRAFGLGAVYAVLWGIGNDNNKKLSALTADTVTSSANALGMKKLAQSKRLENVMGIAFYDGFYSMVSAGGLYVYSHFIAPPKKHKAEAVADSKSVESEAKPEKPFAGACCAARKNWESSIASREETTSAKGV